MSPNEDRRRARSADSGGGRGRSGGSGAGGETDIAGPNEALIDAPERMFTRARFRGGS